MFRLENSQTVENIRYFKARIDGTAKSHPEIRGKFGPVIGIHGVFGGWIDDSVKKYLIENSIKTSLPDFGNYLSGIDHYLPQIDKEVRKNPGAVLLGFSAGGLSLLRYAQFYGWENFEKIITVGTPFDGITIAPYLQAFGQSFKDMMPESKILNEIKKITPPINKVLSIFGVSDTFIPNPKNIKLNWPTAVLGAVSHGDLQNHHVWLSQILDAELGINSLL